MGIYLKINIWYFLKFFLSILSKNYLLKTKYIHSIEENNFSKKELSNKYTVDLIEELEGI